MRLTFGMRGLMTVIVTFVLSGVLTGCSLFGSGGESKLPDGNAWRSEVVTAIEDTPGVTWTDVTVNDVDGGLGRKGPVLHGAFEVDETDAQAVIDDVLRRSSDVLGPDSNGVSVDLGVSVSGGPAQKLRNFGYEDVSNGATLWDATH